MNLTVNGVARKVESAPLTTLLDVLREELGVTSPKAGCEQGGCGACTVLVDGEPQRACLTPVGALDGAEVTTVEGLGAPEALSPLQQAFTHHYAAQCGFCTSGMMLAARGVPEARRHRRPRGDPGGARRPRLPLHRLREDHRRGRRGGAGRRRSTSPSPQPSPGMTNLGGVRMKAVGARLPRYDGIEHVTGPHDVRRRRPRARHALGEGAPLAAAQRGDQRPRRLEGRGDARRPRGDHARGRAAARVRAPLRARHPGRRAAAREGRGALQGPADRRRGGRRRGDGDGGRRRDRRRRSRSGRRSSTSARRSTPTPRRSTTGATGTRTSRARWTGARSARATIEDAFDKADVIVQGVYRPAAIEHVPLETQVALVVPEASGRLTIYSCTQALYFSMGVVAAHLQVPLNKLKVVGGTVGGGFGGKVDTATETMCALLAQKSGRPVKWRWTREEEFLCSSTRAPWHMEIADAVTKDGWILGRKMLTLHDSGRLRALLALRADEALVPPHGRLHDPEPRLRRLRRVHEPRADDGHARVRRHVRLVRDRDAHEPDRGRARARPVRGAAQEREPDRRHVAEPDRLHRPVDRLRRQGARRRHGRRARRRSTRR